MSDISPAFAGDRLAKIIARSGLCSRRDAELWIKDGRVAVNGKVIRTPAFNVTEKDRVKVDGQPLAARQGTRVWLYHKPQGLVVTEKDPEGRATIFETLEEQGLPRVVSIGRLDINTEGLLLLTNDGGLKRVLELPATGWLRRYRVRAFGSITQPQLDAIKDGIEVDGVSYGPIEATLEREQGSNVWLVVGLREGKNREVKNVLAALGLTVNRLIRVSFGPFQLGDLPIGGIEVVRARILREQLGKRLSDEAGVDFDSDMPEPVAIAKARGAANPALRAARPGANPARQRAGMADRTERFRFTDRPDQNPEDRPMAKDRPGSRFPRKPPREAERPDTRSAGPARKVFNTDGSETVFEPKSYGRKPRPDADAEGGKPPFKKDFGDKPRGDFGDRPKRPYGDKPAGPPRGDFGDRPKRPYTGRPAADGADRPKRSYGDKPAGPPRGDFGDRPKRPYSGRPTADGADRPKRSYGDKPAGPPRGDFGDRPTRPYSGRPSADGADRPKRSYGDKPAGAPRGDFGDRPKRPYTGRPAADGADRPKRSYGDKPAGPPRGDFGDRPKRPYTGRPSGDGAAPKRSYGAKPAGDRPGGGGPPKRPRGSGAGGDRPRRPRPPKI